MSELVSLCFLSYNRPEFLEEAIRTALAGADRPVEVIVHDDGSNLATQDRLIQLQREGLVSHLILNPEGWNEGVGVAINRMFKIANGDYLIRSDQDIVFRAGWLKHLVEAYKGADAAMLGGFHYWAHHPDLAITADHGSWHEQERIMESVFITDRLMWETYGPLDEHSAAFAECPGWMAKLRDEGWKLGVVADDHMENTRYGIGPSTVCPAVGQVAKIHDGPFLVLGRDGVSSKQGKKLDKDSRKFDVAIAIQCGPNREANLRRVIDCIQNLDRKPVGIVVAYDGCKAYGFPGCSIPVHGIELPKYEPSTGMNQPKNEAFKKCVERWPHANYVWFLDTDIVFEPDTLRAYYDALCQASEDRVMIGRYDWMAPGYDRPGGRVIQVDPRAEMFETSDPSKVFTYDLGAAMACFGGNICWPVEAFQETGGFWNEIWGARCEDGELGLRGCELGIPMSMVGTARGWHIHHPVDHAGALQKNSRDVPMINARHPWVEQQGLLVVDKDGKRFDWRCPDCNELHNSVTFGSHRSTHV